MHFLFAFALTADYADFSNEAKERESTRLAWVAGGFGGLFRWTLIPGGEQKAKAMLRAKNGEKTTREKPPARIHGCLHSSVARFAPRNSIETASYAG